jgi:hypothetical protein
MPLAKLTGVEGFRSLMARAKALAAAEAPWVSSLQVREDGSLEEFDATGSQQSSLLGEQAPVAIVAQLLGLLVTFIGEPLTLHLVRDAWSDDTLTEMDVGTEEKS